MSQMLAVQMPTVATSIGSVEGYIQTVNRFPVLTPEEELRLARKFRDDSDLESSILEQIDRLAIHENLLAAADI